MVSDGARPSGKSLPVATTIRSDPASATARSAAKALPVATTIRSDPGALQPLSDSAAGFSPSIPVPASSTPGAAMGPRYELQAELGRGGEGAVYRAFDRHADELVALKIIEGVQEGSAELARLRRELAIARRITHPGIVRLHDLVEIDGRWALSMQLVEGSSLEQRIARGPRLSASEIVKLAHQLAEALAAAHEAGITHRDLKPANVLLHADGRPVISDFGISRASRARFSVVATSTAGATLQQTQEGALIGTPLYMSPEQLRGEPATPASDIYALGLVLVEAATGQLPLVANDLGSLRALRSSERAPALRAARRDLPPYFAQLVDRCLSPDPAQRFADGRQLLLALDQEAEPAPPAVPAAAPSAIRRAGRRLRRAVPAAMALGILFGVGLAAWLLRGRDRPSPLSTPSATQSARGGDAPAFAFAPRGHRRITFGAGCEEFPSFLPDSRRLVFDGTIGARSHLFLVDIGGGEPVRITTSPGWDLAAQVAPDGKSAVFLRLDERNSGAYLVDLEGTHALRLIIAGRVRPAFARDGQSIWAGEQARVSRIDLAGRVLETLTPPPNLTFWTLLPLPDGRLAGAFPTFREGSQRGVAVAAANDRSWRVLLQDDVDEGLALAPSGTHVLGTRHVPSGTELIAVPLAGGASIGLAGSSIQPGKGVAVSPDGKRVAWSTCRDYTRIVPLEGVEDGQPSHGEEDVDAARLPGGRLAVLSRRDGTVRPWLIDPAGSTQPRPLMIDVQPSAIAASSDGTKLVLATPRGLLMVELTSGTSVHPLTTDPRDGSPAFRKDDSEVVFARPTADGSSIMVVPAAGGEAAPTGLTGVALAAQPRGDDLLYLSSEASSAEIMIGSTATHQARPLHASLPPGRYGRPDVSPDGKTMAVARAGTQVVVFDLASGLVLRTVGKGGDEIIRPIFDSSGKVYVARTQWDGDIWLADL
jgi:Tol biopolymer transport system component